MAKKINKVVDIKEEFRENKKIVSVNPDLKDAVIWAEAQLLAKKIKRKPDAEIIPPARPKK